MRELRKFQDGVAMRLDCKIDCQSPADISVLGNHHGSALFIAWSLDTFGGAKLAHLLMRAFGNDDAAVWWLTF